MDIETIEVILTASQCENYTKAAAVLGYTPSAVSKRVRCAERELGVELFIRGTKSSHLTPTQICRSLLPHFEDILRNWEDITQKTSFERFDNSVPTIRIGASEKRWPSRIDEIIARYTTENRDCNVLVSSGAWINLREELLRGKLDALFVTMAGDFFTSAAARQDNLLDKLNFILINTLSEMYLAISSDSPLASKKEATLADFKDYAIAFNNDMKFDNSVVRDHRSPFLALSKQYGFELKQTLINTRQASAFLIARKNLVAIPQPIPTVDVDGIVSVRLTDWQDRVSEYLVIPHGTRSTPVARLISLALSMRKI